MYSFTEDTTSDQKKHDPFLLRNPQVKSNVNHLLNFEINFCLSSLGLLSF